VTDTLATNVVEFNRVVENALTQIPADLVKTATKKIALEVLRGVVMLTPVDTGRARGNWQTEIGVIPEGERQSQNPVQDGTAILATLQPFQTVYLANNVPYILYLEQGTEKMAPRAMVARTVARLAQGYAGGGNIE